jgi:hypothetical protein
MRASPAVPARRSLGGTTAEARRARRGTPASLSNAVARAGSRRAVVDRLSRKSRRRRADPVRRPRTRRTRAPLVSCAMKLRLLLSCARWSVSRLRAATGPDVSEADGWWTLAQLPAAGGVRLRYAGPTAAAGSGMGKSRTKRSTAALSPWIVSPPERCASASGRPFQRTALSVSGSVSIMASA